MVVRQGEDAFEEDQELKENSEEAEAALEEAFGATDDEFMEMTSDDDDYLPGEELDDDDDIFADDPEIQQEVEDEPEVDDEKEEQEEISAKEQQEAAEAAQEKAGLTDEEWENIPEPVRKKLEASEHRIRSMTGRVSKLQSTIDDLVSKSAIAPADQPSKPAPTSAQLLEAVQSDEALQDLKEEWPDQENAIISVVNKIGEMLDKQQEDIAANASHVSENRVMEQVNLILLDREHPDWEDVRSSDGFKDFVFEGGPSKAEQARYFDLLDHAYDPQNAAKQNTLLSQADRYYQDLLEDYPDWAKDRGARYNDQSINKAIGLLDDYKDSIKPPQTDEPQPGMSRRRRRLRAAIPATDGRSSTPRKPVSNTEAAESALEEGFREG